MNTHPLLSLLGDGEVHSGESLAQILGISRTAVWKQIRKAEAEGIEIRTIRGRGYQLVGALDLLDQPCIEAQLSPAIRDRVSLTVLPEVDSTNLVVAKQLAQGGEGGPVVIADCQTSGRGRRGRVWASPKGQNLYLSMGLSLAGGFAALDGLSLVLGVAVSNAIEALGATDVGLKWPNDLFAGGRKFGGILVEIQGELQEGRVQVIAGIGINVHMKEADAVDQPWISLDQAWPGVEWQRGRVAAGIISEVLEALPSFESSGFASFRDTWQRRDIFFDRALCARNGEYSGIGLGVDQDGNYRLATGQGEVSVRAGDISLRASD